MGAGQSVAVVSADEGGAKLQAGDHIKVKRWGYSHHGLYVGEDEVVHFAGSPTERWRNARVKRESMGAFLAGATQFEILLYADITPRERRKAVKRALHVWRHEAHDTYNLFFNNCEHFATFCVLGEGKSEQVQSPITALTTVVAAGIATQEVLRHMVSMPSAPAAGQLTDA